jgi:uncharacterized YceG family protein
MADRVRRSAADREAARQARMQRRAATTTLRERRQTGRRRGPRTAGVTGDRRILRRGLAVVPLILVVAAIWFLVELFQPFAGSGHGRVVVDIPRGAGTSRIGSTLARDGVVSSGFFFKLRAKLDGDGSKLLPGRHVMALGMSYSAALQVLTTPPKAASTTNVTIVDGHDRWQINKLLRQQGVKGSYLAETRHSPLLDPIRYGAPKKTPSLEGFLYPDTYQLRTPISVSALVADQLKTFKQQFATVNFSYARSLHLTPYDVLIIASLAEAEATTAHDRAVVASVILNRLRLGMTLGLDTTVAYAVNNYSGSLTQSELATSSPWNTTNHTGLPPTPINSPSIAAIRAVAHPPKTNYLYFIVKVCGNGSLAFSHSYSQFLAESRAYQDSLTKRGLKKTTFCSAKSG